MITIIRFFIYHIISYHIISFFFLWIDLHFNSDVSHYFAEWGQLQYCRLYPHDPLDLLRVLTKPTVACVCDDFDSRSAIGAADSITLAIAFASAVSRPDNSMWLNLRQTFPYTHVHMFIFTKWSATGRYPLTHMLNHLVLHIV